MSGRVRTEIDDDLGWLIFDHPERRNAVSVDMWRAIPEAAARLDADERVRVVVLRGAGNEAFVSGADISEFADARSGSEADAYDEDNQRAFASLEGVSKPVLAMVRGFCVGGGVALALTADVRVAADDARFAIPAARLGLGYSMGGLATLARLVGPSNAKELFFTARLFDAAEALSRGLVNEVVPAASLEERVRELAGRIAANAPLTLRSVKKIVRELGRDPGERDLEGVDASIRACFDSEDYREGVAAFLEKRRPRFRGR